jgi:hypothetical protein
MPRKENLVRPGTENLRRDRVFLRKRTRRPIRAAMMATSAPEGNHKSHLAVCSYRESRRT